MKSFKLIVIGSHAVGKTTLLDQYFGKSSRLEYRPTLGFEIRSKVMQKGSNSIHLTIWDMGGQLLFSKFYDRLFKKTNMIFLMYDITNLLSFEELQNIWIKEIKRRNLMKLPKVMIGNKIDLEDQRAVDLNMVKKVAKKYKFEYMETSALKGLNVTTLFDKIKEHV
ncbi:MAG: Rab family GTPase [Candidatus Helarchaeales archaeon]